MHNHLSPTARRNLLVALESARTRLAVGMAAERTSTPPDRWRHYMAIAERMSSVSRRLRASDKEIQWNGRSTDDAIGVLKRVTTGCRPATICRIFSEIAPELD